MNLIKNIIKKILKNNKELRDHLYNVYKYHRYEKSTLKLIVYFFKGIFLLYIPSKKLIRGKRIKKVFSKVKIDISNDDNFIYSIDSYKILYSDKSILENISIDYEKILNISLYDMKEDCDKLKDSEYKENQKATLDAIEILLDRTILKLKQSKRIDKDKYIKYFENIKDSTPKCFEEALQRILFYNQIVWQTGHTLNGSGRLDKILNQYYINDIKDKKITKEEAIKLIDKFLETLHKYYWFKSNTLLGDTGQIIILGGNDKNNKYFANELTYIFIDKIKSMQLPDPKILLRVSKKMPRELLDASIECIKTGVGSPLFANDDVIIPKLIDFGYDKVDAYNYITSACWEPYIIGKSIEQNNSGTLVYMEPFEEMLSKENLKNIKNTKDLISCYKKYLSSYVKKIIKELQEKEYEIDPLISLFIPNCNITLKDATMGGAVYNNYGATSVSLINVVNSILNVDELVFKRKKYSLIELNEYRKNNYEGYENVLEELKNSSMRFGIDDNYIMNIFNEIGDTINQVLKDSYNKLGGRLKIGYSAPSYISSAVEFPASFDGRKCGDPFIVHISSDIKALPYTELINSACLIDYSGNRFNANVIDFMITPNFLENNKEKFIDFLIISIDAGFFEMQMNVINSETLIKAKNNPKEFPNLIVRVWGFSSYFNDLPENYKDLLIERALKNEGKSY